LFQKTDAETTYQHVIADLPSEVTVADPEEYRLMIQQVYKSLTAKDCNVTFEIADATLFQSSHQNGMTATNATSLNTEPESELGAGLDGQGVDQGLLTAAMEAIENLEMQQQDVWLSSDAQVPLLQFGSVANSILTRTSDAVQQAPQEVQDAILYKVAAELRVLYQNQLQSLRERYGRKYELVLDENPDDDQAQIGAAARITEGFRTAAQHAIPDLCREGQALVDADFSYAVLPARASFGHDGSDVYATSSGRRCSRSGPRRTKTRQMVQETGSTLPDGRC
jgi:excinuclease UvrABC ATPase subunit